MRSNACRRRISRCRRRSAAATLTSPPSCGSCPRCARSEEHTSELQSQSNLVCRLLLEKKKNILNSVNDIAHEPIEYSLQQILSVAQPVVLFSICRVHLCSLFTGTNSENCAQAAFAKTN